MDIDMKFLFNNSYFKFPLKYDLNSGIIFDDNNQMFMDMRGWGHIENVCINITHDDPMAIQDQLGQSVVNLLNEIYITSLKV
jgi:hypothetical protein